MWGACGVLEKTEERGGAVELEDTWLELSWKVPQPKGLSDL